MTSPRTKPVVLFVPQTARNAGLLSLYAAALKSQYDIVYLCTTLFGPGSDARPGCDPSVGRVEMPQFLAGTCPQGSTRHLPALRLRPRHKPYTAWLRALAPSLVVLGVDSDGMGHWTAMVCRQLGLPTLVVQEGCRFTYRYGQDPVLRLKRFIANTFNRLWYPPAVSLMPEQEYQTADCAAFWGTFEHDQAIARGVDASHCFVVGNPTVKPRPKTRPAPPATPTVLFLDVALSVRHKAYCDADAIRAFRRDLVQTVRDSQFLLLWRPHPHTREHERREQKELAEGIDQISFAEDGTMSDYFDRATACMTFPSTAMFEILATGVPLIQIDLHDRFMEVVWDPVERCGAGVTIERSADLPAAVDATSDPAWREKYENLSLAAAEEVFPALGNPGSMPFAEAALRAAG